MYLKNMEHQTSQQDNSFPNVLLFLAAAVFNIVSEVTIEDAYTWLFRVLTLVSLTFVCIINYPKVVRSLREIKELFKKKC